MYNQILEVTMFIYLLDSNLIKASIGGSLHSGINTINDNGSFDSDNKF